MRKAVIAALLGLSSVAHAFEPFRISDIRVEGLERISAGTVFTYLPIERGDVIDEERVGEAIRALYRTGFFSDVQVQRQGDILVLELTERAAISKITLVGNRDIKTEDLTRSLSAIGLAEGEVYDRLQLDRVQQELVRQYFNRGKYNVSVTPAVKELERNRVEITITVSEGKAAKIKHINIVGNRAFDAKALTRAFKSKTTNWTSWYSSDDQYSREKLTGDLESLRSYYQNRGYVDFEIESTQVSISPDKREMFLTANVREGDVYTISSIDMAGEFIVPRGDLEQLVFTEPGQIFSRGALEASAEAMTGVLANLGYAFAEVTPAPEVNREDRTVKVTFLVKPGLRVYVRRVNFSGNLKTRDEVLRREMRQFEGGWYNQAAIDRSKLRINRLGFFKNVNLETPKVPGTEDQVDIDVTVEEKPSGTFQVGLGFSQIQGVILTAAVNQENFLGTGNRVGFGINTSDLFKRLEFSFFDPYWTDDGISRGFTLNYREFDRGNANIIDYSTDSFGLGAQFSFPLNETDRLNASIGPDWTRINLNPFLTPPGTDIYDFIHYNGSTYFALRGNFGWQRDSRNSIFAPTAGLYQRAGAEIALPGSNLKYYKLIYGIDYYRPIARKLSILLRTELGYGDSYGSQRFEPSIGADGTICIACQPPGDGLPFFENFYAGGTNSVRGYEDYSLGPRDDLFDLDGNLLRTGQPLGGSVRVLGGIELLFPPPIEAAAETTQIAAFVDWGNVYSSRSAFELRELRFSAGVAFKWQAPVGPIQISIAKPFNNDRDDRTETLQFTFGAF